MGGYLYIVDEVDVGSSGDTLMNEPIDWVLVEYADVRQDSKRPIINLSKKYWDIAINMIHISISLKKCADNRRPLRDHWNVI